jgi:hypothetical protein
MNPLDRTAEARIAEALERGELDDLPGAGRPLPPDDAEHLPDELRPAYRLLASSGALPEELELRKRIGSLSELVRCATEEHEERELRGRLTAATLRYELLMERRRGGRFGADYGARVLRRLGG